MLGLHPRRRGPGEEQRAERHVQADLDGDAVAGDEQGGLWDDAARYELRHYFRSLLTDVSALMPPPHAPCDILYLVPSCVWDVDWCLQSDFVTNSRLQAAA